MNNDENNQEWFESTDIDENEIEKNKLNISVRIKLKSERYNYCFKT